MSNLIDLMSELEAEILQLRMLLREVAIPELCSYFHVPLVTKEEQDSIIEFGYSKIEVTTLTGHEALQRSLEALTIFMFPTAHSQDALSLSILDLLWSLALSSRFQHK